MPRKPSAKSEEKPQCHIHDNVGYWGTENIRENVCVEESEFPLSEHSDGKHYCLFHLPSKEKDKTKFEKIFRTRLQAVEEKIIALEELPEEEREKAKDEICYYFRYVWFPSEVDLFKYTFSARADFRSATFSARAGFGSATFLADADFVLATFSAFANFYSATFSADVKFIGATFSAGTFFSSATFSGYTDFGSANFTETSLIFFEKTNICQTINLKYAIFAGYIAFAGKQDDKVFLEENNRKAVLNLQNARLEKPDRISFHRVRLRPSWFVNTDSRKMIFTDIGWDKLNAGRDNSNIFDEIKSLEERDISEPSRLLEIACRQLAVNAEENNRYEEASKFRYMAMETKRLEYRWQGRFWTLNWWYKFSSDYGENWKRAFIVLLLLLFLVFPIAFSLVNFQVCPNDKIVSESLKEDKENTECKDGISGLCNCWKRGLRILDGEAFIHSLATATFQNIEYRKPVSFWTEFCVILEKILVPLQAALLALAIRRKFMR